MQSLRQLWPVTSSSSVSYVSKILCFCPDTEIGVLIWSSLFLYLIIYLLKTDVSSWSLGMCSSFLSSTEKRFHPRSIYGMHVVYTPKTILDNVNSSAHVIELTNKNVLVLLDSRQNV